MGVPYSKQLDSAFDQVTPLVASGFRVLKTTRDIAILVAVIQVLTCLLLGLVLLALLALLITVNPDLQSERQEIVTPTMKWFSSWVMNPDDRKWLKIVLFVVLGGAVLGTWAGCHMMREPVLVDNGDDTADGAVDEVVEGST